MIAYFFRKNQFGNVCERSQDFEIPKDFKIPLAFGNKIPNSKKGSPYIAGDLAEALDTLPRGMYKEGCFVKFDGGFTASVKFANNDPPIVIDSRDGKKRLFFFPNIRKARFGVPNVDADRNDLEHRSFDVDIRKIRRRIEDILRKTSSDEEILRIAMHFGVSLYPE